MIFNVCYLYPMEKNESEKKVLGDKKFFIKVISYFNERKKRIDEMNAKNQAVYKEARNYMLATTNTFKPCELSPFFVEEIKRSHNGFQECSLRVVENPLFKEEYKKLLNSPSYFTDVSFGIFADLVNHLHIKYQLNQQQEKHLKNLACNFSTIYHSETDAERSCKDRFEKENSKIKRAFKSVSKNLNKFENIKVTLLPKDETEINLSDYYIATHGDSIAKVFSDQQKSMSLAIISDSKKRKSISPKRSRSESSISSPEKPRPGQRPRSNTIYEDPTR